MKLPHFHRDPNWQLDGGWEKHQCKCGARKIVRAYSNVISPLPFGWPDTRDRHGVHHRASRWVAEPRTGWPDPAEEPVFKMPPRRRPAGS